MAFVTVEDLYGSIECVCFPKVYERMRDFLLADKVVTLTGKVSIDAEKAPVIIVDKISEFSEEDAQAKGNGKAQTTEQQATKKAKSDADKKLRLNVSSLVDEDIEELMETLTFYEGETPVYFVKNGKKMLCSQKVTPNRALMAELVSFLSEEEIKLI